MNILETIKSLRAVRVFTGQPVPDEIVHKILEAGRWTGSAKNVQPWEFIAIRGKETLERLSHTGRYAGHLRGADFAVVIVLKPGGWCRSLHSEHDAGGLGRGHRVVHCDVAR